MFADPGLEDPGPVCINCGHRPVREPLVTGVTREVPLARSHKRKPGPDRVLRG